MRLFFIPLMAAALAFSVTATAQTKTPDILQVDAANVPVKFDTNVYIVRMKEDPVVAYEGGIGRYKATKPQKGKKLNPNSAAVKKYVAYLDSRHDDVLTSVGAGEKIYDYRYALNGFAAVLTPEQLKAVRAHGDVLNVWRDELRQLQTDSTPDYLGVSGGGGVWDIYGKGEDVIIGMLDTGVWPEHQSFSDQNDLSNAHGSSGKRNLAYGPPSNWYGDCQSGEQWSQDDCNNKLIGARYFHAGFGHGSSGLHPATMLSARDTNGHGSHTASTAGGNEGAINTIGGDPVSGIAPRARLAIYKVCWDDRFGGGGCASSDSAAAIDAAVADGVDVINFSIGGGSTVFASADDIAFLIAADAGVWVATSNGNAGPGAQTTGTPAGVPWITAVGNAQDNEVFSLGLIVSGDINDIYDAIEGASPVRFNADVSGTMVSADPHDGCTAFNNDIAGQIALVIRGTCAFTDKYNNAAAARAVAIVVYNDGANSARVDPITMSAPGTTIPGAMIGFFDGSAINAAAPGSVTGTIGPGTVISQDNRIAGTSSRGPNGGAPDVIKPDVAAPGTRIIAAGAGTHSIRISGTSMASPHVAGTFALLKEAHPDWSPAMAKSAVMTSARQNLKKTTGDTAADPFDIGAGHIVPAGAFEPGLVYDAGFFDYLAFTCDNNVQLVSDGFCDLLVSLGYPTDGSDLNLASIGVASFVGSQTVTRSVTSVTDGTTTFIASFEAPPGIDVAVSPSSLTMEYGDTETFTVTLSANADVVEGEWTFGSLTWNNNAGVSPARSPIAVRPTALSTVDEVDGNADGAGDGSVDVPVEFGYEGAYSASVSGLEAGFSAAENLTAAVGVHAWCLNLPANTHFRTALFNEDSSDPGNDDLDLELFYLPNGCGNFGGFAFIGSSLSPTTDEAVDLPNGPAGGYHVQVRFFSASNGTDSDYRVWFQPVFGDAGNTTVTAPGEAELGASGTVSVDYTGLAATRNLGVLHHVDGGGEITRTILDIDAR